jgi:hypothetical protein
LVARHCGDQIGHGHLRLHKWLRSADPTGAATIRTGHFAA